MMADQHGCDMVLLCNKPAALDALLESLTDVPLASPPVGE